MRVLWHPNAAQDIEEIWEFSAQNWGVARADRSVGDIRGAAEALANGSLQGTSEEGLGAGLRRQICGSHVIWFRCQSGAVSIGRVLHQSRDVGRWVA